MLAGQYIKRLANIFPTNYIVETSGSVLQNRFNKLMDLIDWCIVYTFSKIFFTCKIKQLFVGGIMAKESCLTYVLLKSLI